MSVAQERIDNLRREIRNNRISFPSQAPIFEQSRADIQWRLVLLYFLRGWTCRQLSRRYSLTRQRIEQLIAEWVECAVTQGYLQEIPPMVEVTGDWLGLFAQREGSQAVAESSVAGTVPSPIYAQATLKSAQEKWAEPSISIRVL